MTYAELSAAASNAATQIAAQLPKGVVVAVVLVDTKESAAQLAVLATNADKPRMFAAIRDIEASDKKVIAVRA